VKIDHGTQKGMHSVLSLKLRVTFTGLGLKTGSRGLMIWPQNHHNGFLVWASKSSGLRFVGCATKLIGG
jgi:hypothetical protein